MELFLHQVLAGLATGGIYACMALAVVMIYQAIDHLNFAQGEMAMFSTYIAWSLIESGLPYWGAFAATVAIAFIIGVVIERVIIRPIARKSELAVVVVFIGLLVIFNSVAGARAKAGTGSRLFACEPVASEFEWPRLDG